MQGVGKLGSVAVKELANIGVKIIGVSDRTGGFYDPKGLPVEKLLELATNTTVLKTARTGEKISNAGVPGIEVRYSQLPPALEMQIAKENAPRLQCRHLPRRRRQWSDDVGSRCPY